MGRGRFRGHAACVLLVGVASCSAPSSKNGGGVQADAAINDTGTSFDVSSDVPATLTDIGISTDPNADNDHDGYLQKDDCNDFNPLINPGAIDFPGDGIDSDCDGKVDNFTPCDSGQSLTASNPTEFTKAIELCRYTTEGATGTAKTWGVISATLQTTDGVGTPAPVQYAIEPAWGNVITPHAGADLIVLSTGSARLPSQAGFFAPRDLDATFKNTGNASEPPAGWPHNTTGCPGPPSDKALAYDSMVLKVVVRVPTNAQGFSFDFNFFTAEYLSYVCSQFNDTFIATLKSSIAVPANQYGNIAADSTGDPINVNSGFFDVCTPGSIDGHTFGCAEGITELAGTGFDQDTPNDGATGWLRSTAPVKPGEEIEIDFMIWNTGDHLVQSSVLIDNWQWSKVPVSGSTQRPPS